MREVLRGRWSLLWLLAPVALFLLPLPLINRPFVLGPWLLAATLLTPLFVYLAARGDPLFRPDPSAPDETEAQ